MDRRDWIVIEFHTRTGTRRFSSLENAFRHGEGCITLEKYILIGNGTELEGRAPIVRKTTWSAAVIIDYYP